jgi:hypothetical protein
LEIITNLKATQCIVVYAEGNVKEIKTSRNDRNILMYICTIVMCKYTKSLNYLSGNIHGSKIKYTKRYFLAMKNIIQDLRN